MLLVTAFLLAFAGAALIALAKRGHWVAVIGSPPPEGAGRRSRALGWTLLLLCIGLAVMRDGWGMGMLLGPLLIAAGLALVVAALAIWPALLRAFAHLITNWLNARPG